MSKTAYIFPGQGSQAVGMGKDLFDNFAAAREVFEAADEALGFSLSEMCFSGDEADLQLTANTQPSILTASVAAYRAAIGVDPGHSDAFTNLGILLNGQGRTQEAVICFCKVITSRPKHPEARRLLALAHCTLGEVDKAVAVFEEWLGEEPGHDREFSLASPGEDEIKGRAVESDDQDAFPGPARAAAEERPDPEESREKNNGRPEPPGARRHQ